jgi:hypothetical protein
MQHAEPPQRPRRAGGGTTATVTVRSGQQPAWVSEVERTIPVDVAFDRVLIDTPDLVAFAATVHVYPSGFCFTLSSQLRPTASAEAEDAFTQEFEHGRHQPVPAEQAERSLRLGVRFPDGRGAALNPNARWLPHTEPEQDAPPLIRTDRMSSDSAMADCEIRVVGLPSEGNVELFYRWLSLDVPEASIELDGDALRSASAHAVVLWDVPTEQTPSISKSRTT